MSSKSKYFYKKKINHGNNSVPHITEELNEVGPFGQQELDVTSEKGLFEWYILFTMVWHLKQ